MHTHEPTGQSIHDSFGPKIGVKKRGSLRRLIAFVGPAYLVSVGYMDPGNWATDIEGGARFGYMLIWVLLMSNIMALVLQTLCARLGIATGLDLAQGCRREYRGRSIFFSGYSPRWPSPPRISPKCSEPSSA
jgi:manganese transport protein